MTEDKFNNLISTYIIPQFPISIVEPNDTYRLTENEAVQPGGAGPNILAVRPRPDSSFRLILKRSQGFDETERNYIKYFIQEAVKFEDSSFNFEDHAIFIQNIAVARTICLDNNHAILKVLQFYEILRERTYEGSNVAFSCLVDLEASNGLINCNIEKYFDQDFFIVLSNGIYTTIELDVNANIKGYTCIPKSGNTENLYTPMVFYDFCDLTTDSKIGIILTVNGDILIFKNKEMIFARRRGTWKIFSHEKIVRQISPDGHNYWSPVIRKALYLSALDVSFMHTGGLLYISRNDNNVGINTMTFETDIFSSSGEIISKKAELLNSLVHGQKFHEIDRSIRKEIASIDGAILMKHDGTIISIGAIVTKTKQSKEGSRSAAAIGLSEFGFSIKISTDGAIKGYFEADQDDDFKPRFVVG